jgi:N-hydroxyarylamine O-acetyltransferase
MYVSPSAAHYRRDVDELLVSDYLSRIGVARPPTADAAALRELHRAHLMTVPFENLSIHLSEPISLADSDLLEKIVSRRRGGFCYELNGAFALLLEALGFKVARLAARVYGEGRFGPPFDHLALAVRPADGSGPMLADVGFGSHSTYPLLLNDTNEQDDPGGRFQTVPGLDGDLDVLKDSEPQYRLEQRPRTLEDFVPTCWWQQTAPQSHFRINVICSRLTEDGRISIGGRTLIRTSGGVRTERELANDDELLAAYREHFGIALDQVPALHPDLVLFD